MSPSLIRQWARPSGFLLVALCLLLPFLIGSCSYPPEAGLAPQEQQAWRVTYTGMDLLVGGAPEVEVADNANQGRLRTLDDGDLVEYLGHRPEPLKPHFLAWLTVALLATAAALGALRSSRWTASVVAGLAAAATATLVGATILARRQATDAVAYVIRRTYGGLPDQPLPPITDWEYYPAIADMFRFGYGFWVAIGVLLVLTGVNTAHALDIKAFRRRRPHPPEAATVSRDQPEATPPS